MQIWGLICLNNGGMAPISAVCHSVLNKKYRNHTAGIMIHRTHQHGSVHWPVWSPSETETWIRCRSCLQLSPVDHVCTPSSSTHQSVYCAFQTLIPINALPVYRMTSTLTNSKRVKLFENVRWAREIRRVVRCLWTQSDGWSRRSSWRQAWNNNYYYYTWMARKADKTRSSFTAEMALDAWKGD